MNHLLKSPFCVHPKSGLISVPIPISRIRDFKPYLIDTGPPRPAAAAAARRVIDMLGQVAAKQQAVAAAPATTAPATDATPQSAGASTSNAGGDEVIETEAPSVEGLLWFEYAPSIWQLCSQGERVGTGQTASGPRKRGGERWGFGAALDTFPYVVS